jgi:hypothetical protein
MNKGEKVSESRLKMVRNEGELARDDVLTHLCFMGSLY